MGMQPRLEDRFTDIVEIPHRGMAEVFRATHLKLDRQVVLKRLALDRADPGLAERFLAEARIVSNLKHLHIVEVYDYFELDGYAYISMEYLEHGTLRPWVGRLSVAQFCGVFEAVLSGLNVAWGDHIVHRDLKPDNLMLTAKDDLKIVDFGIAKLLNDPSARGYRTVEGTTIGTPEYMAPEQAGAEDVGCWTDLYSAGIVAWELMVGRVPFTGDSHMAIMRQHIDREVPPARSVNPGVDPDISRWIDQMTAKQPPQRWSFCARAWEELEGIAVERLGPDWRSAARLSPHGAPAEGAAPLEKASFAVDGTRDWSRPPSIEIPKTRRWPALAGVLLGGLAVIGGAVGYLELTGSSTPAPAVPTDVPRAQNWLRAQAAGDGSLWIADPRGRIQGLAAKSPSYDLPDPEGPVAAVPTAGGTWIADRAGVNFLPHHGRPIPFVDQNMLLLAQAGPDDVVAVDARRKLCLYRDGVRTAKCGGLPYPVLGLGATANTAFVAMQTAPGQDVVDTYSLQSDLTTPTGQIRLAQLVPPGSTLVPAGGALYVPVAHGVAVAALRSDSETGVVQLAHTPTSLAIASGTVYAAVYASGEVAWWNPGARKPITARATRPVALAASNAGIEVVSADRTLGLLDTGSRRVVHSGSIGVADGTRVRAVRFRSHIVPTQSPAGLPGAVIYLATGKLTAAGYVGGHTYWQPGLVKPAAPLTSDVNDLMVTVRGTPHRGFPGVTVSAVYRSSAAGTPVARLTRDGRSIVITTS
ncbi:MAG: serine/threonine protein kinase [Gaiellales bacterium]